MKRYEFEHGVMIPVSLPREKNKGCCKLTNLGQLSDSEGLYCLDSNALEVQSKKLSQEGTP